MKIFHDVISDDLRQRCLDYVKNEKKNSSWIIYKYHWPEEIGAGVIGNNYGTPIPVDLFFEIVQSVSKVFPEITETKHVPEHCLFYVWSKLSSINWHDDGHWDYGLTIYLNETWEDWQGGFFLWKDENGEMRGIEPKKNMMVLNDEAEEHMVTVISPYTPEDRISIQMFLSKA
jgi:hypothetical protein